MNKNEHCLSDNSTHVCSIMITVYCVWLVKMPGKKQKILSICHLCIEHTKRNLNLCHLCIEHTKRKISFSNHFENNNKWKTGAFLLNELI